MNALAYELTGTKDVLWSDAARLDERVIALTTWATRRGKMPALIALIEAKRA